MTLDFDAILGRLPGYDPRRDADGYHFDEKVAATAINFFGKHICHMKGKLGGKPYVLEPHEESIVANLFGWKNAEGRRRYRECLIGIPRKNSKTTLTAGICLLVLALDREPGKEIYCAAADAKQADILFSIAKYQMGRDEYLSRRCKPFKHRILLDDGASFFEVLSSTPEGKFGFNPSTIVFDEFHVVEPDLIEALETGAASRENPLTVYLTTRDYERESPCNTLWRKAEQVRDGEVRDPAFLPILYCADKDDDWTDPAVWARANPMLGKSVTLDYLKRSCERARVEASYQNTFKRLHLCMPTEQDERWLLLSQWDACRPADGEPTDPVVWREVMTDRLAQHTCWGGLDLGSVSDLTALVLVFDHGGRTVLLPYFWVPEEGQWRTGPYHKSYEGWISRGFISTTPGNTADYQFIREDIRKLADQFGIAQLIVDNAFQGAHLCTLLREEDGMEVLGCPQTYMHLTSPSLEFESRITSGKLNHGRNEVLRWMAGNVSLQQDATGKLCRPVKPKNQRHLKIDGIVAAIMGLSRLIANEDDSRCAYDDPEMSI